MTTLPMCIGNICCDECHWPQMKVLTALITRLSETQVVRRCRPTTVNHEKHVVRTLTFLAPEAGLVVYLQI